MRNDAKLIPRGLLILIVLCVAARLSCQTLTPRSSDTPKIPTNKPSQAYEQPILAQGTNLQVEITRHYPMKANQPIEARLLHPIFVQGKLAIPQDTPVHGTVVKLTADTKTRWHGRLRGDFTPFHIPQVRFDQLILPSGAVAISTTGLATGAPVLHLQASGSATQGSIFSRYWAQTKTQLHDRIAYFTAPGFGDRALQLLYHQLPYHPERIEAKTMYSFDFAAPLALPGSLPETPSSAAPARPGKPELWSVNALLTSEVTSATAKVGDPVQALVVEPVFDENRQLVVPQDSILIGRVTASKAARSFGRNGKLRFTFQQVRFPEGSESTVQGLLAGATTASAQGLSLNAEGTVSPRNQSSVIAPLLLTALAGRALDEDGNLTVQTGVASNGFGLVGRVVGVAAGNRDLAAGIGYYAAALSVYENFLRPGHNVDFVRNTRIEIETTPLRAPVLTPEKH
ncbi:hypothetical protein [Acidicapsa acidisoli]|uniref:hypothetical protein n=1 Tax=Acidicapsa acidisoli TaxID=1615681 RepID=UPI0021E02EBA|nr:hypothetical protein [Acidicapsa acidisoli]